MRAVKEEMLGNEVGENPLSGGTSITYESGGDSLREEIQAKWKTEIGDAVLNNQVELAQKMSLLSKQVVDFVMNCRDILGRSQTPNVGFQKPLHQQQLFPSSFAQRPQNPSSSSFAPPSAFATSSNSIPVNFGGHLATSRLPETMLDQLKKSLHFAQIVSTRDNSNADRLMLVFGRCWKTTEFKGVTQAIITTDSSSSREAICSTSLPPVNAVCILPNPEWMCSQRVWDALDDFLMTVQHIRSRMPTTSIMIATLPVESGTNYDPCFYQFNQQLRRCFDKPQDHYYLIETRSLLPGKPNTRDSRGYQLADDQCHQLVHSLADRLAHFRP